MPPALIEILSLGLSFVAWIFPIWLADLHDRVDNIQPFSEQHPLLQAKDFAVKSLKFFIKHHLADFREGILPVNDPRKQLHPVQYSDS